MQHRTCLFTGLAFFASLLLCHSSHSQVVDSSTGHMYIIVTAATTWPEAEADAESRGGTLATITSQHEQDFIASHAASAGGVLFIGATDEGHEGVWQWVTGEPWAYSNWFSGEPNNGGSRENVAVLSSELGYRWNDVALDKRHGYIIEIDTTTQPIPVDINFGVEKGICRTLSPTIYWGYRNSSAALQQRVEVTILEFSDSTWSPRWASGEVYTSDTTLAYLGPPLVDETEYQIQIRLHDGDHWGGMRESAFRVHLPKTYTVPEPFALHEALYAAAGGDSILVSPGTYVLDRAPVATGAIIVAHGGPDSTFLIMSDATGYVMQFFNAVDAVVDGFTLIEQKASSAFIVTKSSVTFRNMRIRDCTFSASCITGGAGSTISITRSLFSNVTAPGGAIAAAGCVVHFSNNTVYHITSSMLNGFHADSHFENNIFAECAGWAISGTSGNVSEMYNCFWNNSHDVGSGGSVHALSSTSKNIDPRVASNDLQAYHLLTGSPCINSGNPDPAYNDPDGSPNDMGFLPYFSVPMNVVNIFVDGSPGNLHAFNLQPAFNWNYADPRDRGRQVKLQFQVNTGNDWLLVDTWDSGEISQTATTLVYYGSELQRGRVYYLRMRASAGSGWSQWHFTAFRIDRAPSIPVLNSPPDQSVFSAFSTTFQTRSSSDADGDTVKYQFRFYKDMAMTDEYLVLTVGPFTPGVLPSCAIPLNMAENSIAAWQVRSWDGYMFSDWSSPRYFGIDRVHEAPLPPFLAHPVESDHPVVNLHPQFSWHPAVDPDPFQVITYQWQFSTVPSFLLHTDSVLMMDTTVGFKQKLAPNKTYYWRVFATDPEGMQVVSAPTSFRTYVPGDIDGNANIDIGDLSEFISRLFISPAPFDEPLIGDVNGDCQVDIVDLTRLIDYLFMSMQPLDMACGDSVEEDSGVQP